MPRIFSNIRKYLKNAPPERKYLDYFKMAENIVIRDKKKQTNANCAELHSSACKNSLIYWGRTNLYTGEHSTAPLDIGCLILLYVTNWYHEGGFTATRDYWRTQSSSSSMTLKRVSKAHGQRNRAHNADVIPDFTRHIELRDTRILCRANRWIVKCWRHHRRCHRSA